MNLNGKYLKKNFDRLHNKAKKEMGEDDYVLKDELLYDADHKMSLDDIYIDDGKLQLNFNGKIGIISHEIEITNWLLLEFVKLLIEKYDKIKGLLK